MHRYLVLFIFLLFSCDGGLKPEPKPSISGFISFEQDVAWPSADSMKDLRVVAFRTFPFADSSGIIDMILSGDAIFSESLEMYTDTASFLIELESIPDTMKYIAVAQQYGTLFEWKAVGVYTESGDPAKNSALIIDDNINYMIDIHVDFNNLPPQPF